MLLNDIDYQLLLALIECYRFVFDIRCYTASGIASLNEEEKIKFIEEYAEIPAKIDLLSNYFSSNVLPPSIENIDIEEIERIIQKLLQLYPSSNRQIEKVLLDLKYLMDFTTDFKSITDEIKNFQARAGLEKYDPLNRRYNYLSSIINFKKSSQKEKLKQI